MKPYRQCLVLCSAAHFVVDFACALTVVSLSFQNVLPETLRYQMVITYNVLAFGSQPFCGLMLDRIHAYRAGMLAGIVLTGIGACLASVSPIVTVVTLGCGNALFHLGAGALVYKGAPGRASGPGVFIAPGGMGLFAGIVLGGKEVFPVQLLVPFLAVTVLLLYRFVAEAEKEAVPKSRASHHFVPAILILFLVVVALRSFSGFALPIPWKGCESGAYLMAVAVFTGKASGGFLADRLGWRLICGFMLVAASSIAAVYDHSLLAACAALFCLQSTTGIIMSAIQDLFPEKAAFAFGLTCVALLMGAYPFLLPHPASRISGSLATGISLVMALAALGALTMRTTKEE